MSNRDKIRDISRKTADKTKERLAPKIASLTRLSEKDIKKISKEVDEEKLYQLVELIKDTSTSNDIKAQSIRNITGLTETAVAVLKQLL